ncbi:MAG: hypothetical protein AAF938_15295, partial [Myxococcota bacterium]
RDPRYARHWIVPEIGDEGQQKLEALRLPEPTSASEAVASDYLRRSGAVSSPIPDFAQWPRVESRIESDLQGGADALIDGAFIALEVLRRALGHQAKPVIDARETER